MRIWSDERGSTTLAVTAAAGFALGVFVLLANVLLLHYVHGVARTAVDEAVRHGAIAPEVCGQVAGSVLAELAGGEFGAGLVSECSVVDGAIRASVTGVVPSLVPLVPDRRLDVVATAELADG